MGCESSGPTKLSRIRMPSELILTLRADLVEASGPIDYSALAGCLLSVITLDEDNVTFGVNGWKSNEIDIGRYGEDMT